MTAQSYEKCTTCRMCLPLVEEAGSRCILAHDAYCILAHDVHIIMLASDTGELSEAASTVTGGSCPLTAGAREESGLGGQ